MRGSERGTNIRAYVRECSVRYISYATVGWAVNIKYMTGIRWSAVVQAEPQKHTRILGVCGGYWPARVCMHWVRTRNPPIYYNVVCNWVATRMLYYGARE